MSTLDHVGFAVADYQRREAFYEKALAPLGLTLLMEFSGAAAGFGTADEERPSFFIEAHGEPVRGRLHIALRAESRAQVGLPRCGRRSRRDRQRGTRPTVIPPRLLRRLRPRSRRQQHRGRHPHAPVVVNARPRDRSAAQDAAIPPYFMNKNARRYAAMI